MQPNQNTNNSESPSPAAYPTPPPQQPDNNQAATNVQSGYASGINQSMPTSAEAENVQQKPNRLVKALKICIVFQLLFLVASLLYGHFVANSDFDQYVLFLLWIFAGFTIAVILLLLLALTNIRKNSSGIKPLLWSLIVLSIIATAGCATFFDAAIGFGFQPTSPTSLFDKV